MNKIKSLILEEYKQGNIVITTNGAIRGAKLSEFIERPVDEILYNLNRNEAVVLTFIDDPKWINDYAVCKVIRALKSRIDELKNIKIDQ